MGMSLNINAIETCHRHPRIYVGKKIAYVTLEDDHICALSAYVIHGWPSTGAKVMKELHSYWYFRKEVAVIDGIVMKGRRIIAPASLHKRALGQVH